jgi:hypothetical protein
MGGLKDRPPLLNLYSDVIDLQFDGLTLHGPVILEYWKNGTMEWWEESKYKLS